MLDRPETGPRIGLWGTFDVRNFGDALFPRIFRHELGQRLPDAEIRVFTPGAGSNGTMLDPGLAAEPLGPWSFTRAAQLAGELDLIAIGGGDIIHTRDELYVEWYGPAAADVRPSEFFVDGLGAGLERFTPIVWHGVGVPFDFDEGEAARVRAALEGRPYLSVRDRRSRQRLVDAGVQEAIEVVPDSAVLVRRILSPQRLEEEVQALRRSGSYPGEGRPLAVQGARALLPHIDDIAAGIGRALDGDRSIPVVVVEAGEPQGDAEFGDALAARLPVAVHRLPPEPTIERITAALAHARAFVGLSMHAALVATLFGVPSALISFPGYSKLEALAGELGTTDRLVWPPSESERAAATVLGGRQLEVDLEELARRADRHFDALAHAADEARRRRTSLEHGRIAILVAALEAADERCAYLRSGAGAVPGHGGGGAAELAPRANGSRAGLGDPDLDAPRRARLQALLRRASAR